MPPQNPSRSFQAPRGTRDFYPIEMARRLWLEDKWRRVATRHGFDEISGPTFEHLDLYTVKSGEGIVSELFSFTREGGETAYALRPEFTPTLARMVASKANALSKPIKWHSIGPYFRAERPQRGRLREFTQWNVDVLGDASPEADAEVIACCVDSLREMGLGPGDVSVSINSRLLTESFLRFAEVPEHLFPSWFNLLDRVPKLEFSQFLLLARELGASEPTAQRIREALLRRASDLDKERRLSQHRREAQGMRLNREIARDAAAFDPSPTGRMIERFRRARNHLEDLLDDFGTFTHGLWDAGLGPWLQYDSSIVRGLAYYTGTVFEVHETGGKERAIAGGGRYDNLVELFGGPATPAVGFAMGDVVIALVLQDKGLMPTDDQIARDLGLAPDVFVICADEEADKHLRPVLAALRSSGLHARRTYRSTKNVGKILGEASKANARFALIIKPDLSAELKDMGAASANTGQITLGPAKNPAELAALAAAQIPPISR